MLVAVKAVVRDLHAADRIAARAAVTVRVVVNVFLFVAHGSYRGLRIVDFEVEGIILDPLAAHDENHRRRGLFVPQSGPAGSDIALTTDTGPRGDRRIAAPRQTIDIRSWWQEYARI